MTNKLIIFTRYPEPGLTKTRLIDHLGAHGAANLQRQMTEKMLAEAEKHPSDLEVRYFGGSHEQITEWLGKDINSRDQGDGDLGEKLARAFEESFSEGYKRVVIIGADCPELTDDITAQAYAALNDHDLVIGPANDGGYYLVGLTRSRPELFQNQPWGSDTLKKNTLDIAESLGLKHKLLDELHDIDRPDDLSRIRSIIDLRPALSVIFPTLNEENSLAATLEPLSTVPDIEVVVADGGSTDRSLDIARDYGAKIITCKAGRGTQQNSGANAASATTLLFLHADTLLPDDFARSIYNCLEKPEVVAGAFKLKIALPGAGIRLVEKGANLRSRLFQLPYGDQAIFIRKKQFEAIGGFPEIEIMEDFALIRKLRSIGKIETLEDPVKTSGRRWKKKGVFRTTMINQAMIIGYLLGFSPTSLASWYRSSLSANS